MGIYVIANVLNPIPETGETIILWCHTTCPLFNSFNDAIETYLRRDKTANDSLVAVSRVKEFILTEAGQPVSYSFGQWHQYSQFLPKFYSIHGRKSILGKLEKMLTSNAICNRIVSILYEINEKEALDIDTEMITDLHSFYTGG